MFSDNTDSAYAIENDCNKENVTLFSLDDMDFCCSLGNEKDPNKRNCYRRVMELDVGILGDKELVHDCKAKYLNCCITAFGLEGMIFDHDLDDFY